MATYSSDAVSVLDLTTNTVLATVLVGSSPVGVAVTPDGSRVYVTNNGLATKTISVIDTATNTVTATINVPSPPYGIAINPAGTRAYVGLGFQNVAVIDTTTNSVVATIPVGFGALCVAVNPTGTAVYATLPATNEVAVIDTTSNTVTTKISVGESYWVWPLIGPAAAVPPRVVVPTLSIHGSSVLAAMLALGSISIMRRRTQQTY